MAKPSLLALCSLVALALTLSGCGGTYDPDGTTAQTTQAVSSTSSTAPSPAPPSTTTATTTPPTTTTTTTTTTTYRPPLPPTTTTTLAPAGPACPLYNGTHGCYAGKVVDLSVMFVCGPNEATTGSAVYPYSTTSCCAQGVRFNPSTQMCCYDGVHNSADGFCAPWWDEFPTECYCPWSDLKSTPALSSADHVVVDTRIHPSNPCHYAGEKAGCLNGYEFDYSQQMPCGNFIIDINTHGCCPTNSAFSPYNLKTQSCCQWGDGSEKRYEVNQGPHACSCRKFGCGGASEGTSVAI